MNASISGSYHKGIRKVTEAEIAAIPEVPPTDTWNPIHHKELIERTHLACKERGIEPVETMYEVSGDGKDLMAVWHLPPDGLSLESSEHEDMVALGFRNSMKKRFSLGICGGRRTYICWNLCMDGKFVEMRRHTSGLTVEIMDLFIGRAVEEAIEDSRAMGRWMNHLTDIPLKREDLKCLVYDCIEREIINGGHFNRFHDNFAKELAANKVGATENYAHFHGAATRTLRNFSLSKITARTAALNELLKEHVGA